MPSSGIEPGLCRLRESNSGPILYVGRYKLVVSYQVVLCVRWTQVYVEHTSKDIEVRHGYLAKIHSPERVCVKVRYL